MTKNNIEIVKASGEREAFRAEKVRRSLQRAGVERHLAQDIAERIAGRVKDGMTTKEIYRQAFSLLQKARTPAAARYSLKKAIFQLGPEGYPFERFVGKLLERQGYKVQVGQVVRGKCVSHEIDVIAEKSNEHFMVECKFHNQQGIRSDVKVALYVKARFEDVQAGLHAEHKSAFHQAWLITNTKFTSDAVQYARCVGMKIIGWKYPPKNGLEEMIERAGLHPLTCLTSLSPHQKRQLLGRGFVLCREIIENPDALAEIGVKGFKQKQIINDVNRVCA